jgi:hypothetical protein
MSRRVSPRTDGGAARAGGGGAGAQVPAAARLVSARPPRQDLVLVPVIGVVAGFIVLQFYERLLRRRRLHLHRCWHSSADRRNSGRVSDSPNGARAPADGALLGPGRRAVTDQGPARVVHGRDHMAPGATVDCGLT